MNRRLRRSAVAAGEMIGTALLGFLIASLLAGATGGLGLLSTVEFGPPVGAILAFGPYSRPASAWQIGATRSVDHRHCILQPAIMAESRGSMVVERRLADGRTFYAHWRGGPTSEGGEDCGSAVDITLDLAAMQTLVNADPDARHWHPMGS